jgi:hypothetical protein
MEFPFVGRYGAALKVLSKGGELIVLTKETALSAGEGEAVDTGKGSASHGQAPPIPDPLASECPQPCFFAGPANFAR